jgi:hypothetical protein
MKQITIPVEDTNKISDGYHTFGELYEHRITLFIALCKELHRERERATREGGMVRYIKTWRSKLHSDKTSFEGWFVLGIGKDAGDQITYHLPMSKWDETSFAETLECAPEFDGHTSNDVLERLKSL